MSVSFIVPTVGRSTLTRTLMSIETWPGDEILLVGDASLDLYPHTVGRPEIRIVHCPAGNDWGHSERNVAMPLAKGHYIAHIDDDDAYVPGVRALLENAMVETPDRPLIFRMRYHHGGVLWQEKVIQCGAFGTPCFVHVNDPPKIGGWGSFYGGDAHFFETCKWKYEDYVWREEVICLIRPA